LNQFRKYYICICQLIHFLTNKNIITILKSNIKKKKINNIYFIISLLIKIYHDLIFFIISIFTNGPRNSEKLIFYGINSKNIDEKASLLAFIAKLGNQGWYFEPLYKLRNSFEFFKRSNYLRNYYVTDRFFVSNKSSNNNNNVEIIINIENKKIVYDGINYFNLIDETLSNYFKCFKPNYKDKEVKYISDLLIESLRNTLAICYDLKKLSLRKKIFLILTDTVSLPNSVFIIYFSRNKNIKNLFIYSYGYSYRIYHNKGKHYGNTYMLSESNSSYFHHFYTNKTDFENWYSKYGKTQHIQIENFCKKIFESDHNKNIFRHKSKTIDFIQNAKNKNKKIYCLFAHLSYDKTVYDYTNFFNDMLHWIKITIEIFKEKDSILLIKPHIMETILNVKKQPSEKISDLVDFTNLPNNIILLESNEFLPKEVFKFIDYSLIWRSTAYLESIYFNKPALFCGPKSYYSDALINYKITDKKNYKNLIDDMKIMKIEKHIKYKNISLIYYLNFIKIHKIDIFNKSLNSNHIVNIFKLLIFLFSKKNKNFFFIKMLKLKLKNK